MQLNYTQRILILTHLRDVGGITAKEASDLYGIERLGARIWELRQTGLDIRGNFESGVNRYGRPTRYKRYWLAK